MSFALQPTHLIPVLVKRDWSVANDAADDIADALEASFPGIFYFPMADGVTVTLVYPLAAGSDKAVVAIAATTGDGTLSTAFSTTPAVGEFVYLIDLY